MYGLQQTAAAGLSAAVAGAVLPCYFDCEQIGKPAVQLHSESVVQLHYFQ